MFKNILLYYSYFHDQFMILPNSFSDPVFYSWESILEQ